MVKGSILGDLVSENPEGKQHEKYIITLEER
jgi:hypothetical protein